MEPMVGIEPTTNGLRNRAVVNAVTSFLGVTFILGKNF